MKNFKDFKEGFIAALLWAEFDSDQIHKGIHKDSMKQVDQLLGIIWKLFHIPSNIGELSSFTEVQTYFQLGHSTYLSVSNHGAGLWDFSEGEPLDKLLPTKDLDVYIGDNRFVYVDIQYKEVVIHFNCHECSDEQVSYEGTFEEGFYDLIQHELLNIGYECTNCSIRVGSLSLKEVTLIEYL